MLLAWVSMVTRYVGAPHPEESPGFIPRKMWDVISAEVLRQCDGLDGGLSPNRMLANFGRRNSYAQKGAPRLVVLLRNSWRR